MELLEQIKIYRKAEAMIKVGTRKGAGFFYCDTISSKTLKEIEKISNKYLSNLKSELKVKKDLWKNFDKYWKERIDNISKIKSAVYRKRIISKTPKDKQEEMKKKLEAKLKEFPKTLKKNLKEREHMRIALPKRIETLEKEIPSFVPLLDRVVISTYDAISPDEPNTKIIIVKGKENGDYSNVVEYQDRDLPSVLKRRIGWQNKVS